jgi:acetyltransferase-like isoleucine patch superfamily enzyme
VKKKSVFRQTFNRIIHIIARFSPGAETLRPFLHKLRGVKINGHIFIGDDVYIENEYPECIEIGDGTNIALRTTIIAHLRGSGRITIGANTWIGAGCTIATTPGQLLTIGEGSVLAAGSVVIKDIPPYTFVGGVPARPIARVTVPLTLDTSYKDFKNGLVPIDKE